MNILTYDDNKDDISVLSECIKRYFVSCEYDYKLTICKNTKNLFDDWNGNSFVDNSYLLFIVVYYILNRKYAC